jgi:putative selenium metabolism protein SsnA
LYQHGRDHMKLYANALVITNDENNAVYDTGCVGVENGIIAFVGSEEDLKDTFEGDRVDLAGQVVMPGQILGHTHLYSYLARGLSPGGEPKNFIEQLEDMWWRLDRALGLDDVYWSAKGGCLEALLSGTTTVIDHHASPSCITGSLEAVARGMTEVGVRGALAYEITDRNGPEGARLGLEENLRGVEIAKSRPGLLASRIGLHASFTLGEKTLRSVSEAISDSGVHVHVAEDVADVAHATKNHGMGVLERLVMHGLVDEKSILVHGVHLDVDEVALLVKSGAFLVHNPRSNMNNGVGAADLSLYEAAGVNLAIGTDGMGSDPAPEAMAALLLQRHRAGNPSVAWPLVERMYCAGNAGLASRTFGIPLGRLQVGAAADFAVRRYSPPTPLTPETCWGHFLFGISTSPVVHVVVAGEELVRDGHPVHLDSERVGLECRRRAMELWARW